MQNTPAQDLDLPELIPTSALVRELLRRNSWASAIEINTALRRQLRLLAAASAREPAEDEEIDLQGLTDAMLKIAEYLSK